MTETIKLFTGLPVIIEKKIPVIEDVEVAKLLGDESFEIKHSVDTQFFDLMSLSSFYALDKKDPDNNMNVDVTVIRGEWGNVSSAWIAMNINEFIKLIDKQYKQLEGDDNGTNSEVQETK